MGAPYPPGQSPEYGYGPPPFKPSSTETPKKRGKGPLTTGLILMAIGLVAGIGLLWFAIVNFPDPGEFARASGEDQPVELTAGTWTVFAEGGVALRPSQITGPDGATVPIGPLGSSQTYTFGDRSGEGVGSIDAPVDGTYLVTTEPGVTVAFGQNFGSDLVKSIIGFLGGVFIGGGLVLIGLIVTVVALTRRRRQ